MELDAMILVFWMLSFKPAISLSSFTFIKRLFSSSLLSAIRVVSSTYLRLLIFLPAILIPACTSSSLAFRMMYSACKLNKQGYNIQPWHTPFPIWNQSVVPCPVLTVASWPAYRFLRRQVRWSGIPISLRIFHCFPHCQLSTSNWRIGGGSPTAVKWNIGISFALALRSEKYCWNHSLSSEYVICICCKFVWGWRSCFLFLTLSVIQTALMILLRFIDMFPYKLFLPFKKWYHVYSLSTDWCVDEQKVVFIYNGMLLDLKKGRKFWQMLQNRWTLKTLC